MHFLDKVQLAYSCPLAWDKLIGGDERRFCMDCQKHVTNLSAMTRPQAEAWLAEQAGAPICVRVEVDAKGRSVHRPALRGAALAALALGAAACTSDALDSADTAGDLAGNDLATESADRASAGKGDHPPVRSPRGPAPGAPSLAANRANAASEQDFAARGRLDEANRSAEEPEPTYPIMGEPPILMGKPAPPRPMMGVMPPPPEPPPAE